MPTRLAYSFKSTKTDDRQTKNDGHGCNRRRWKHLMANKSDSTAYACVCYQWSSTVRVRIKSNSTLVMRRVFDGRKFERIDRGRVVSDEWIVTWRSWSTTQLNSCRSLQWNCSFSLHNLVHLLLSIFKEQINSQTFPFLSLPEGRTISLQIGRQMSSVSFIFFFVFLIRSQVPTHLQFRDCNRPKRIHVYTCPIWKYNNVNNS